MALMGALYHYTSAQGLLGILGGGNLWVTNIRYMNDSTEFSYSIGLLKNELNKCQLDRVDAATKSFCDFFEKIADLVLTEMNVYTASFSSDSDSLGQWRGYAPPNQGYSIGFDRAMLEEFGKQDEYELQRCCYDESWQKNKVCDWLVNTKERLFSDAKFVSLLGDYRPDQIKSDSVNQGLIDFIAPCFASFLKMAVFFKHPKFKEENEWRLYKIDHFVDELKFRVGLSMLIPYREFYVGDKPNLIMEVMIGPCPHPDLSSDAVKLFLKSKGLSSELVRNSKIPFRSW